MLHASQEIKNHRGHQHALSHYFGEQLCLDAMVFITAKEH